MERHPRERLRLPVVEGQPLADEINAGRVDTLVVTAYNPVYTAPADLDLAALFDRVPNVILLHAPQGKIPPKMPRSVSLPCNAAAKAVHMLGGVSGWGYPYSEKGGTSLIVRLHYAGGKTEDHALKNGEHFADYIRRVDVPGSKFAFNLRGRQIRYLAVRPERAEKIERIEFVKGPDATAPVVMAVTLEAPE